MDNRQGDYGNVSNTGAGVPARKHKLNRSNIEQEENERMTERRLRGEKELFPWTLHKQGGLSKTVHNQSQYDDAMANGWHDDIRNVPELEPKEAPTSIAHMTIAQSLAFVEEHADDAAKLAEIEADETAHGNRAKVVQAIEAAKDAFGTPKGKKAKK